MELNIISPEDGFVDFSYILGNDPDGEYTENATLDWGDGSEIVSIIGNEYSTDKAKLQHTYAEKNKEYKITIKGKIKWVGSNSDYIISTNTRNAISSIKLPTNNSPIYCLGYWSFYCFSNLQSIPEGLFDNHDPLFGDAFQCAFYNCSSLQSIPEGLFDNFPEAYVFIECFYGCSSVTSNLPTLWISHPSAYHSGCFNYCDKAPNYADAYNAGWATSPAISLSLNTLNDNSIVDLSSHITPLSDNQEVTVNWGDGSEIETLQIDNVQHTYATKGEYVVEIDGDIEYAEPKTKAITAFTISNVTKNEKAIK